jgi:hypothetical protein
MGFKKPVTENISHNDLSNLVNSTFSVDQYKSKLGDDENVIVIAFVVMDIEPAQELSQFLETGHDSLDMDVSTGPNADGHYSVYVELNRDSDVFSAIDAIINDVARADNNFKNVKFTSYENKAPQAWSEESFNASVITSSYDYVIKHNPEAKAISERINFLNRY